MGMRKPHEEIGLESALVPISKLSLLFPFFSARSYMGSLWQDGAGWTSVSPPESDLPSIELAAESNHYCHSQKGPGNHCDPKKEQARRQLYVASAICLVFMIGEVIGKDFCDI